MRIKSIYSSIINKLCVLKDTGGRTGRTDGPGGRTDRAEGRKDRVERRKDRAQGRTGRNGRTGQFNCNTMVLFVS